MRPTTGLNYEQQGRNVVVYNIVPFNLEQTLDCGQAFRWCRISDSIWQGIAHGRLLKIGYDNANLTLYDTDTDEFNRIWRVYFDLDRDYSKIIKTIKADRVLAKAVEYAGGIRILRQNPWETLCSFIISQNNNIKRIKGIIQKLCMHFGNKISGDIYGFPPPQRLAALSVGDLDPIKCGFRAKYILDAAQKVATEQVDIYNLHKLPLNKAREQLLKIYGVGPKVADCTLLFGCGFIQAFPQDVWIKRAVKVLFNGRLPDVAKPYAGIVQQYIFHYARMTKLEV